jgi:hypothetical protein
VLGLEGAALGADLGADLIEAPDLPPTLPPDLAAKAGSTLINITEQMAAVTKDYLPKLIQLKPGLF